MIPIRNTIPSRNYPVVNNSMIVINIIVYLVELAQGAGFDRFIYIYGLVPARYSVPEISSFFSPGQQLFSFFSFMFLHGGFWHLLSNMWSLYIFGDNVEDRLGSFHYLFFYLLCGVASGLVHMFLNLHINVPTIGASGAIAGVMGAYFILYPNSKILTLIPILFIPWFIEIPAFFFLGFWFVLQLMNAAGSSGNAGGIAWWAHIGGFLVGVILLKVFLTYPAAGITERLRRLSKKKKTHRLQVIRPYEAADDPNLYGTIIISSYEAYSGTSKLINILGSGHKRLIRVIIPSGIKEGTRLRLEGLGKYLPGEIKGDLFLKVKVGLEVFSGFKER
jgi:membrane associated rhomboid family serine protease